MRNLSVVSRRRDSSSATCPIGVEILAARFVHSLVRMCSEEVALRLQQIRRQTLRPIAIVERKRRRDRGSWNANLDRLNDRLAPTRLVLVQRTRKKVVQQQVCEIRFLVERSLDVAQENTADDASSAPHQRDSAHVQVPTLILLRRAQQHIALRVAHHLRAIQRSANVLDELLLLRNRLRLRRPAQYLRRLNALILQRRQAPRKHALADQR